MESLNLWQDAIPTHRLGQPFRDRVFGDYTSKCFFGLTQEDRKLGMIRKIAVSPQGIDSFGTDERGGIYVVGYKGMIYRLDFSASNFDETDRH